MKMPCRAGLTPARQAAETGRVRPTAPAIRSFIKGGADITVSNLAGRPSVDVVFTNIRDEKTRRGIGNMLRSGLKLKDVSFGREPEEAAASHASRHPAGISGRFHGPDHDEVGGLFGYAERVAATGRPYPPVTYSGAFGGKRS